MKEKLIDKLTVLMAGKFNPRANDCGVVSKADAIDMAESVLAFRQTLEEQKSLKSLEAIAIRANLLPEFHDFINKRSEKAKAQDA